jgi:hypothetical protein
VSDDGLDQLREQFPGWEISAHWITVPSGADMRILYASKDQHTISGLNPGDLAANIRRVKE